MSDETLNARSSGPIPQDVIDIIIDTVIDTIDDDQRTLHALALVSTSCLVPSRRRAFTFIRLLTFNSRAFLRLLESPLCTLRHCRRSTVIIDGFDFDDPEEDGDDDDANSEDLYDGADDSQGHRWLARALALPPHTFAFVHHLSIDIGYYPAEISQTLAAQLPLIFSSITTLSLQWWTARGAVEIARFAAPYRHLQRLVIDYSVIANVGAQFDAPASALADAPPPPPGLRELEEGREMRIAGRLAAWMLRARPPVKLERLVLWGWDYDIEGRLEDYLVCAGDSLRELCINEIYKTRTMDALVAGIPWTSLIVLEKFTLNYDYSINDTQILTLLRALRALPALRHLALEGHLIGMLASSRNLKTVPQFDQLLVSQFDQLFRPPGFPELRTLSLIMMMVNSVWETRHEVYPVCTARGILVQK
ncbi:hypothetical protein HGRIS_012078 [Hohenbuehelia grisea]|uniref:Uncharacterized protein n=1 Tax=Hohenbuehelia grisea TaxID=104357 RepID=A0ABR3IR68_9AGAR